MLIILLDFLQLDPKVKVAFSALVFALEVGERHLLHG
jgi:hypothetical protein